MGLVDVRISADGALAFAAPAATLTPFSDALIGSAINSDALDDTQSPTVVDMGIRWLLLPMTSGAAVRAIEANASDLLRLQKHAKVNGIAPFGQLPQGESEQDEVRALFVENGSLVEDPVTGSANACLARYFAAQGDTRD